ncbi:MAG: chemotaxis protein CheX [Nannocystaceae bacterium]
MLQVDTTLLSAVITGTVGGMSMTGIKPVPVGASRYSASRHSHAVMVGLVGRSSGSVSLNMSESGMLFLAGQLMGEPAHHLDEDAIDAAMELGNMTAGCIKEELVATEYDVSAISLPSLIIGSSYAVMFARGIITLSVEFEIGDVPVTQSNERLFCTTISLLRGSGA